MKARHLILLLLKESGGKIVSKTKIQKEIYFVSLLLGEDFGFKAYYYGPYSLEVEHGLDELVGAGFVNVERDIFGIDTKYGFDIKRYNFSLSDSGKKLAEIKAKENTNENAIAKSFLEKLRDMGDPDYLSLSIAAKAYFILDKEGKALNKEQIMEIAMQFGWKVNKDDIIIAVNILKTLDFVKER